MSVLSVVTSVCATIGVTPPAGTIFVSPTQSRTMWEMLALANEMAQRIAYDTRDWSILKKLNTYNGDDTTTQFSLPSDYKRMLKDSNIYSKQNAWIPLRFISDTDEWLQRRLRKFFGYPVGEWTIIGNQINIFPPPPPDAQLSYYYLHNAPVNLAAGGVGTEFVADADSFAIDERILKLGMIWQWKAQKGGAYAEDMSSYEDALAMVSGSDKPSPIIVGRYPVSRDARFAYPWPVPTNVIPSG